MWGKRTHAASELWESQGHFDAGIPLAIGSLATLFSSRHSLRTGRHLSKPGSSPQILAGVNGGKGNSGDHLPLTGGGKCVRNTVCHQTISPSSFPLLPYTHIIHLESASNTSKSGRYVSFYSLSFVTVSDSCSLCFL